MSRLAKRPFDCIFLIANPKSSGDGLVKAKELRKKLRESFPKTTVEIKKTQRPGHASDIAATLWKKHPRALFISVSGDGGYHDMVNGLMKAAGPTRRRPLCAIHGAGYGNDHQRSIRGDTDLVEALQRGLWRPLDLLKVDILTGRKQTTRYAHSYVGFGITGDVAGEIDKTRHTWTPQWLEAMRGIVSHEPIPLSVDGKRGRYHSLLILNVSRFGKFLQGADNTKAADGRFEVVSTRAHNRVKLLRMGLQALSGKLGRHPQKSNTRIDLQSNTPTQFDGEPEEFRAGTTLRISSARHAVRTLGQ